MLHNTRRATAVVTSLFVTFLSAAATADDRPAAATDWDEVLGPPQGALPSPMSDVMWRDDLRSSLTEAQATGRPLFVTFRCLPCKQCADFDKDVLEGGPQLSPLLGQFITVRLTDANLLDLSILPAEGFQDFDLSWWGYFLSPRGHVYGVFGGRDEVSDSTRISEAALVNTLERVLQHHYDPRRSKWNIDGPVPIVTAASRPPKTLPGYDSWSEKYPQPHENKGCLHCHQVVEVLRQPGIDQGLFDNDADLDMWPLPENVGIELDRDHGLLVTAVRDSTPAQRAGIMPGDVLAIANGRRLFGQADLRGVLHRNADPAGSIEVHWLRDDQRMTASLHLKQGWRQTVLAWRTSVSGGNIGSGPGFSWPVPGPRNVVPAGTMSIKPWFGKTARQSVAHRAGLRGHHTIIAVDGESPDLAARPFLAWFRLRHNPGDDVTLTILDRGEKKTITYKLPVR